MVGHRHLLRLLLLRLYTRRGKKHHVGTNSVQTMQNHETCSSPETLHISPDPTTESEPNPTTKSKPDPTTESEPDPTTESAQSPTQAPDPPSSSPPIPTFSPPPHIFDYDLPIALRKESRTCTRYPLNRFCTYAALSTDHRAFTTSLDSYSIPKNVAEALQHPGWFSAMQEEMSTLWKNET